MHKAESQEMLEKLSTFHPKKGSRTTEKEVPNNHLFFPLNTSERHQAHDGSEGKENDPLAFRLSKGKKGKRKP